MPGIMGEELAMVPKRPAHEPTVKKEPYVRGPGDSRITRQGNQRRKQVEGVWSGLLGKAAYSVANGLGYQGQGVTGPRGMGTTATRI